MIKHRNSIDSIRIHGEFDLNELDESDLQYEKHADRRIATFPGISIVLRDENRNALNSIRLNRKLDSHV
jgi:hypothetical protein